MNTPRRPIPAHLIARARGLGEDAVTLVHEVHDHGHRTGWREGSEAMRSKAIEVCREAIELLERARGPHAGAGGGLRRDLRVDTA